MSARRRKTKKIAVLTGGGDCPGLNAAIRAVARSAAVEGIEVFGIEEGFLGLYENRIAPLDLKRVSGILTRGGTILKTSRFNPFKNRGAIQKCLKNFSDHGFDGLVTIGGDGSLGISHDLWKKYKFPVIGIPKTIDNDVYGTDRTIGFYTAVQTAVDALDRLHTTAESHKLVMVMELMGRHCGFLTAYAGIAGGADYILVPEFKVNLDTMLKSLKKRYEHGKNFSIVVVAEDAKLCDAKGKLVAKTPTVHDEYGKIKLGGIGGLITDILKKRLGYETRYTRLGHVQRGGSPTVIDRLLATSMGCAATELAQKNAWGSFIAYEKGKIVAKDISVVRSGVKRLPKSYYEMSKKFFI